MSKNLLDNGTVLTLGLVGAVAAIGVAAKRGVYGSRSTATSSVMERLMRQLNGHGSRFEMEDDYLIVDDDANVSIVAVDSPLRPDAQGQYRPGVDEAVEPTMVEVAKRKLDRSGNLVGMKVLGQFSAHDAAGIARALSSHRAGSMKGSRSRGSRAMVSEGIYAAGTLAGRRGSRALSESQAKAVARKVVDALGGEDEAEEQVCYPMYLGDGAPTGSEEARGYARAEAKLLEMVERFGGSRDDLAEVYSAMTYIINPSG